MRPTKYKLVTIVLLAISVTMIGILVLDWVSEPGEQAEGINAPTIVPVSLEPPVIVPVSLEPPRMSGPIIVPAPLESPWTPWTLGPTIEERVSALEERAEQEQYRKFLREARR